MRVTTSDGVGVEVHVDGPEDAPPVVLLHGITLAADEFDWLVDRLTPTWRVVRPDFRGHGDSDRLDGPYEGPGYVADAVAVLEAVGPAPVVGHSLGGVTALAVAQLRPELVTAVLAVDPGLPATPVALAEDLVDLGALEQVFELVHAGVPAVQASGIDVESFARQLDGVPTPLGGTASEVYEDGTTDAWARSQLRLDARVLTALVDDDVEQVPVPFDLDGPVEPPVLLLAADPAVADAIARPVLLDRMRAAGSPALEIVTIAGAGHNLLAERANRSTFLDHLDRFLVAYR